MEREWHEQDQPIRTRQEWETKANERKQRR